MTCAWDYLTFIWKVDPPSVYPCDTTSFQTSEKRDILRGKPCLEPAGRRSQSRVYSICLASVASGSTLAVILVGSNSALVFTNRRHHARHHSPRHPCCKSCVFLYSSSPRRSEANTRFMRASHMLNPWMAHHASPQMDTPANTKHTRCFPPGDMGLSLRCTSLLNNTAVL